MESLVYKKIVADIEKEENGYVTRQLNLIKDKIDKLNQEFPVTVEDIMIVLLDFEERFKKIHSETYDETIRHSLEHLLSLIERYFKNTNYDGDIVNSMILSNGVAFADFERENYLKKKALNIKNKVAYIIKVIALIILLTCCVAFIAVFSINKILGLYVLIGGIVSSIFVFALGEIIQILHDIRRNMYKREK